MRKKDNKTIMNMEYLGDILNTLKNKDIPTKKLKRVMEILDMTDDEFHEEFEQFD